MQCNLILQFSYWCQLQTMHWKTRTNLFPSYTGIFTGYISRSKSVRSKRNTFTILIVIAKLNSFQCRKQNHSRHFKQEGTCREFEASKVIGRVKGIGCRDLGWASGMNPAMIQNWFTRGAFTSGVIAEPCWKPEATTTASHTWETGQDLITTIQIRQIMKLLPPPPLLHILKSEDGHLIAAAWQQVSHNIATIKNLKKMAYASLLFSTHVENI